MSQPGRCPGSGRHLAIRPAQMRQTGGHVRPNQATGVRCPDCGREFVTTRISYADHGIPTNPQALVPNHNPKENRVNPTADKRRRG